MTSERDLQSDPSEQLKLEPPFSKAGIGQFPGNAAQMILRVLYLILPSDRKTRSLALKRSNSIRFLTNEKRFLGGEDQARYLEPIASTIDAKTGTALAWEASANDRWGDPILAGLVLVNFNTGEISPLDLGSRFGFPISFNPRFFGMAKRGAIFAVSTAFAEGFGDDQIFVAVDVAGAHLLGKVIGSRHSAEPVLSPDGRLLTYISKERIATLDIGRPVHPSVRSSFRVPATAGQHIQLSYGAPHSLFVSNLGGAIWYLENNRLRLEFA